MKRRVDDIDDAIGVAAERVLSGKRRWRDEIGFASFLTSTVQSVVWAERSKEKRRAHVETEVAHAEAERSEASPEARMLRAERHARLREWLAKHTQDDPEVAALCQAILDGAEKPREQAEVLGWNADRVDAVLKRLQRRLLEAARPPSQRTKIERGASALRRAPPRELESDLRARDE